MWGEQVPLGALKVHQEFACKVADREPHDGPPNPVIEVTWQVVDGAPVCREVVFRAVDSEREVTRKLLEETSLATLLEQAIKAMLWNQDVIHSDGPDLWLEGWEESKRRAIKEVTQARSGRKAALDEEALKEVAEVYRANISGNPTQAVATHFGKQPRTARLYVKKAREAGYLGSSIKGKAGER